MNPNKLAWLLEFFDETEEADLNKFHCAFCNGAGKRKYQMGGPRTCDQCRGSGFSQEALADAMSRIVNSPSLPWEDKAVPVSREGHLREALGVELFDDLKLVADDSVRSPVQQLHFWIRKGVSNVRGF